MEGEETIMKVKGNMVFRFDDIEAAKAAIKVLEGDDDVGKRSRKTCSLKNDSITILIDADDVVSFRACVNSALRELAVFEDVEKNIHEVD